MRSIKVKVNNDRERDAVLLQFEREGCRWHSGREPMNYCNLPNYPYYIVRHEDGKLGYTDDAGILSYVRTVPVASFMSEGDKIIITSDGKIVIAEMGDRKGIAKCSPDDEFSLETGAKLALDRMFELQVGDKVKCVDGGYSYTTFVDAIKMHCDKDMCVRYAYNTNMRAGEVGEVKYLLAHPFDDSLMAVVDTRGYDFEEPVYLIGVKGLKKYEQQR